MNDIRRDLIRKRRYVGWIATGCLTAAAVAFLNGDFQSAWASSCLRIGIVLGAMWAALPTRTRPAAWEHLSGWKLLAIIVCVAYAKSLRFALPVLLVAVPILLVGFALGRFFRRSK
ncbi:MAG: hypothetical protein KDA91_09480 [Planctomycetaceae bacterium]|nr:hypothetical protein [Planctomycetaceae bacterium]